MCVILICPPQVRPSEEVIRQCWQSNPHGAGIAWRENGEVRWRKTDDIDELMALSETKRGEIVLHFRIASVGRVCAELRHPFPVEKASPLSDSGKAKAVLFQNGTWGGWREALDRAARKGHKVPAGEMSDARAAAWLCSIYGKDYIRSCGASRWVFFGAHATSYFGDWHKLSGILYSNLYWRPSRYERELEIDDGDTGDECAIDQRSGTIPGATPDRKETPTDLWEMSATKNYWDKLKASCPKPKPSKNNPYANL